jgi:hypothetical protein
MSRGVEGKVLQALDSCFRLLFGGGGSYFKMFLVER